MRSARTLSVGVCVFVATVCLSSSATAQQVSIVPRTTLGQYPTPFLDACNHMDQWPTVLSHTFYLGSWPVDLWAGDDPSLSQCFANMRSAGLQLTLEAASFQPQGCGTGVDCFQAVKPILDRLIALGAPPIRIRLQEPLTAARYAGWAKEEAINNTVNYMWWIQNTYSSLQVVGIESVEAYPYNSRDLLNWWMTTLRDVCVSVGVAPPDGFEVDHDFFAGGAWSEIGLLQAHAGSLGLTFGYIFGSPVPPGQTWENTALTQDYWLQQWGTVPNVYTFESWEASDPPATVPEWSGNTMMNAAYSIAYDFPIPYATLTSGYYLLPNESVSSPDGRFFLYFQADGNLVLYQANGTPLWASNTYGIAPGFTFMQGDGNFVVYDTNGTPRWASGTQSSSSYLSLRNDGNMVIALPDGTWIWTTNTGGH